MKTDFHPQRTARFLGRTDEHILVRSMAKLVLAEKTIAHRRSALRLGDRLLAGLNVLDLGPRSCSRRDRRRYRYSRHREWRAAVSFSRPSPRPDRARPARGSFCSSRRPRSRWCRRRQPSQGRPSPDWRDRSAIFDSRRSARVPPASSRSGRVFGGAPQPFGFAQQPLVLGHFARLFGGPWRLSGQPGVGEDEEFSGAGDKGKFGGLPGFPAALPCDQSGSPWRGDGIKAFLDAVASP
jgi:hypothetical protein